MMGVKSGTTEPAILVCNCYHLLIYVYGLTNLLMFILTFDQDFHFAVIQGLKKAYKKVKKILTDKFIYNLTIWHWLRFYTSHFIIVIFFFPTYKVSLFLIFKAQIQEQYKQYYYQ